VWCTQLPAIADSTWITDFQAGILYFHVAIFIEYCICHYAYRQKKKVKKDLEQQRHSILELEMSSISVRKTRLCAPFCTQNDLLPRQARDKHRENSKQRRVFCRAIERIQMALRLWGRVTVSTVHSVAVEAVAAGMILASGGRRLSRHHRRQQQPLPRRAHLALLLTLQAGA
jgi:hypothetical protein